MSVREREEPSPSGEGGSCDRVHAVVRVGEGEARSVRVLGGRAHWLGAITFALLSACGGATVEATPIEHVERVEEAPPPSIALHLVALSLHSEDDGTQTRPPMYAEMFDDGRITGTRCGATSISADGVLRREDEVVARLVAIEGGAQIVDGAGHDTGLVLRDHTIETASGEVRFRRDASTIVSLMGEVPHVEIAPAALTDLDTALALYATLLVCNDLGP